MSGRQHRCRWLLPARCLVLAHPVHATEVKHSRAWSRRGSPSARLGRALADHVDHLCAIQSGSLGECKTLRKPLKHTRYTDLIHHLCELPDPAGPSRRTARIDPERGGRALEHIGLTADHDREGSVLCADLTARHGRVEKTDPALPPPHQFSGEGGRCGGVIDEQRHSTAPQARHHRRTQRCERRRRYRRRRRSGRALGPPPRRGRDRSSGRPGPARARSIETATSCPSSQCPAMG